MCQLAWRHCRKCQCVAPLHRFVLCPHCFELCSHSRGICFSWSSIPLAGGMYRLTLSRVDKDQISWGRLAEIEFASLLPGTKSRDTQCPIVPFAFWRFAEATESTDKSAWPPRLGLAEAFCLRLRRGGGSADLLLHRRWASQGKSRWDSRRHPLLNFAWLNMMALLVIPLEAGFFQSRPKHTKTDLCQCCLFSNMDIKGP